MVNKRQPYKKAFCNLENLKCCNPLTKASLCNVGLTDTTMTSFEFLFFIACVKEGLI